MGTEGIVPWRVAELSSYQLNTLDAHDSRVQCCLIIDCCTRDTADIFPTRLRKPSFLLPFETRSYQLPTVCSLDRNRSRPLPMEWTPGSLVRLTAAVSVTLKSKALRLRVNVDSSLHNLSWSKKTRKIDNARNEQMLSMRTSRNIRDNRVR